DFFFQAEDGIRALIVTGVQTCALPISWPPDGPEHRAAGGTSATRMIATSSHRRRRGPGLGATFERVTRPRSSRLERSRRRDGHQSEERRVGKRGGAGGLRSSRDEREEQ